MDKYLSNSISLIVGDVIDIGGKKEKKRGNFRPPLTQVKSWQYVNIDKTTSPDYCCNAENIPVADASFDTALLCEVIEHLERPVAVLREALRVLKTNGTLIISIPFLFPLHADPHDYQRWTERKIRSVLQEVGFSEIHIATMGGVGAVIQDLLLVCFNKVRISFLKSLGFIALKATAPFFNILERAFEFPDAGITTGYFVIARK